MIIDYKEISYEELAHALYLKGKEDGFSKVTDKTKWREPVIADKLGHRPHSKISAGANSNEYGSDAFDPNKNIYAEYKSSSIKDDDLTTIRKLLGIRTRRNLKEYKIGGIYNGAYKQSAIDAYLKVDHYFAIFFEERCILIAKIPTDMVISQFTNNNDTRKPGKSTNLSTVTCPLSKAEIVFDNRQSLSTIKGL